MNHTLSYLVIIVMICMALREVFRNKRTTKWFWLFLAAAAFNIYAVVAHG